MDEKSKIRYTMTNGNKLQVIYSDGRLRVDWEESKHPRDDKGRFANAPMLIYSFSMGNIGENVEKEAEIYSYKSINIVVVKDIDKNKQTLNKELIQQVLELLPHDIITIMQQNISIVDYENPMDEYWAKEYGMEGAKSYAIGGDNEITFFRETNHYISKVKHCITHEIGHKLDKVYGKPISDTIIWRQAQRQDEKVSGQKYVSKYGEKAAREDFADSVRMYILMPNTLKKNFPNRYNIIKEAMKYAKNKQTNT